MPGRLERMVVDVPMENWDASTPRTRTSARAQRGMTWSDGRPRLAWLSIGEAVRGECWGKRLEKAAAARSYRPCRLWEGEDVLFLKHRGTLEGK